MKTKFLSRFPCDSFSWPFSRALLPLAAAGLMLSLMPSCVSKPEAATSAAPAVRGFDLKRYEGRWYEIARLDHPFERNQTNVTATYSASPDGGMLILNRGYDTKSQKWKTADGHARMVGDAGTGSFKSKVYSPFYATYHVIALDQKNYNYALVSSEDKDHLWILSRSPHMNERTLEELKQKARALGYPVEELFMVSHEPMPEAG